MIRSTLTIWPRSADSSTTSAPIRWAKSFSREPKKPHLVLSTLSPGSTRFMKPASIAEFPEEDRQIVSPCPWRQRARSPSTRSSRMSQKSGSRWPFIGSCIAANTSGWTLDGPGPHNSRSPGSRAGSEVTRSAMALPFHRAPVGLPAGTKARSIGHGSPRAVARRPERRSGTSQVSRCSAARRRPPRSSPGPGAWPSDRRGTGAAGRTGRRRRARGGRARFAARAVRRAGAPPR